MLELMILWYVHHCWSEVATAAVGTSSLTNLGTVIVQAGKDVVHEVELPAWSVRQYEAGSHD